MKQITPDELRHLASHDNQRSVSIYMPLHRTVEESKQNTIRFRNLVDRAEDRLVGNGLRGPKVKDLLRPARDLQRDPNLGRASAANGMGVLIAPGFFRCFRLPYSCPETVVVGKRFHLSRLVHALRRDDRFYLLGLSPKNVKLFRGRDSRIAPVSLPENMPQNIDQALAGTEIEKSFQYHTSAPGGRAGSWVGIMHGQGRPKDEEKKLLTEYFRIVAKHVEEMLKGEDVPLVLAAVDYYHPMFREVCRYPHLLDAGVTGSPDKLTEKEMLERALPVVQPKFDQGIRQDATRYLKLVATERTSDQIETVLPAAVHGQVEVLFSALGVPIWGRFDAENGDVRSHTDEEPGDEDLLDLAVTKTIAGGGTAYVVTPEHVPADGPLAAILRW